MSNSPNKLAHLDMIQRVIDRQASNSSNAKGWNVGLVSAIFFLSSASDGDAIAAIALLPSAMFWLLDAYYLHQERAFRSLYDKVRSTPEVDIDFSMQTDAKPSGVPAFISPSVAWFHGPIFLASLFAAAITVG